MEKENRWRVEKKRAVCSNTTHTDAERRCNVVVVIVDAATFLGSSSILMSCIEHGCGIVVLMQDGMMSWHHCRQTLERTSKRILDLEHIRKAKIIV